MISSGNWKMEQQRSSINQFCVSKIWYTPCLASYSLAKILPYYYIKLNKSLYINQAKG